MFGKRRRRGLGLGGLLVILAVLYFTGAAGWMWERVKQLDEQCYRMMTDMGMHAGLPACQGIGKGVSSIDGFIQSFDNPRTGIWERITAPFSGSAFESMVGDLRITSSLAKLGSSKDELAQRMRIGPESMPMGTTLRQQVRDAVDNFSIAQRYINDGGGSDRAIPWLQQGARVQGYGVMSQLSLGDLYARGTDGVAANPNAAMQYYAQAYKSIDVLQRSGTPESQSMLKALPADPQDVKNQLLRAVQELKIKK